MLYAEVQDVEAGFRALSRDEQTQCAALLSEAAVIIDSYNPDAGEDAKRVVSCRMVRRQLGESDSEGGVSFPVGSTQGTATALDGRTVQVNAPLEPGARVNFIAELEELQVADATPAAKVVINARTGSIVLNQAVTLGPCAIAHGNLAITISSTPVISQPNPLSQGQTVVAQKSDIQIKQEPGIMMTLPPSPQLADVVRAINTLGATPQDLLAILQAIKAAGALNAELEVI